MRSGVSFGCAAFPSPCTPPTCSSPFPKVPDDAEHIFLQSAEVDWYESNFVHSAVIAEYYNTVSG